MLNNYAYFLAEEEWRHRGNLPGMGKEAVEIDRKINFPRHLRRILFKKGFRECADPANMSRRRSLRRKGTSRQSYYSHFGDILFRNGRREYN